MKVECVHCGASGQMDEAKIPPGVTSVRCPRCREFFPIPGTGGSPGSGPPGDAVQDAAPSFQPPPIPVTAAPFSPADPPPAPAMPEPQAATAAMAGCVVCSGPFPRDEMVRFGASWVCAACKPDYVQMLTQGKTQPGEMRYAGFWIRFGAKFLDGLILGAVNIILSIALGYVLTKSSPKASLVYLMVLITLECVIAASYSGFFLGKYRATPGKMACGLVVVTPEGQQISVLRGVGRYFAQILSSMILYIGYLMVLFDDEKKALHDLICNTRVVYK